MKACEGAGFRRKCPGCFQFFIVCESCDRGHRYCHSDCKSLGRKQTFKRSSRLYQSSPTGRHNHRKRQKRYRKNRLLKKTVTQHSLETTKKSLKPRSHHRSFRMQDIRPEKKDFVSSCVICRRQVLWFFNSS